MLIRIENCGECPAYVFYDWHLCGVGTDEDGESFLHEYPTIPAWCPLREREVSRSMEKRVNVQRETTVPLTKQIRGEDGEWLTTWTGGGEGNPCSTCGGSKKIPAGETLTAGYNPCPDCKAEGGMIWKSFG